MADSVRRLELTNFTVSRVCSPYYQTGKLSGLLIRSDPLCVYAYKDPVKPLFCSWKQGNKPAVGPLAAPLLLLPGFVDT